ncbi:MAG TPA: class I SAM-dependent methyltransferase [Longimicrobiaceae bacterium]|jgi:SAM-dependent methyltransferase|nr:class I SAM-dependent methyltransferase [Longimicrobiaceae bacterium]
MRPAERILLALSRPASTGDYAEALDPWTVENALGPLRRSFPDLDRWIRGKRVLDFGCGSGFQAAALAREGAAYVLGVDTNARVLDGARALARREGLGPHRLAFAAAVPEEGEGTFDAVISQNAMEHFGDPAAVLGAMRSALAPGGRLLVTFGPPWMAPSGSHMHFFTRVPWVNLLFSERTVMAVRARYRSDGARRYEEVESGLNRMTLRRFERVAARSGLRFVRRDYRCVKGLHFLARLPAARELFVNVVDAVLEAEPPAAGRDGAPAPRVGALGHEKPHPHFPPSSVTLPTATR